MNPTYLPTPDPTPNQLGSLPQNQSSQLTPNNPAYYTQTVEGRALAATPKPQPSVLGASTTAPSAANNGTQAPPDPNANAAPKLPDRSGDISQQNAALGQLDPLQSNGIGAIHDALSKLNGRYDTEAATNQSNYQAQSDTNQNNLLRNQQSAYVNAAQGRRGLLSTLASLGALSGSGVDLANRAVQQGANADLAGAGDSFKANQTGLDQNIANFKTADEARRQDNQNQSDEAVKNAQNQTLLNRQKIFAALADDYSQQGDKANAAKYTGMANNLYPDITNTATPSSNLAYNSAAFTPTTLSNYIGGARGAQVSTTPGTAYQLPGLIANNLDDRRKTA